MRRVLAQQIEKTLIADPVTTLNHLFTHHRDVSRRTAEGSKAEPQKQYGYFSKLSST